MCKCDISLAILAGDARAAAAAPVANCQGITAGSKIEYRQEHQDDDGGGRSFDGRFPGKTRASLSHAQRDSHRIYTEQGRICEDMPARSSDRSASGRARTKAALPTKSSTGFTSQLLLFLLLFFFFFDIFTGSVRRIISS